MTRLLPFLLALLLASCAPVRDFNAAVLNEAGSALNVLTGTGDETGGTVTITPPAGGLEQVRLDLEAIGPLSVQDEACRNATEAVVVCEWEALTVTATVTFAGERISGLTTYRLPGETTYRWEFLRY